MGKWAVSKIAVTGCGCVCAAGVDTVSVWRALQDGTVNTQTAPGHLFPGKQNIPVFSVEGLVLPDFSEDVFPGPCSVKWNRTLALTLTAAAEAIATAGLSGELLREKRVGIVLGTTVGCTFHNETYYVDWKKGRNPGLDPVYRYLSANLAESVQGILGVRGPRLVVTNACASGTDAIGLAKMWLQNDLCDVALAGGADELSRIACQGFSSLMLTSHNPCRPFDAKRDGLNLGEGAGVLILEKEEQADARNGNLMGWVKGYGVASDAYHPTAPHPLGRGLQHAVRQALSDADVTVEDIAFINAHGTGTRANDIAETTALHALSFKGTAVPVISTKGVTGHTLGAAGGIEAVLTLLALNNGKMRGTIGCRISDPDLPVPVLAESEQAVLTGRIGMSQSLAFGGGNSALILEGCGL